MSERSPSAAENASARMPSSGRPGQWRAASLFSVGLLLRARKRDRKSTRLNSTHHYISYYLFFFNDTATTEIYTLPLHDALPISGCPLQGALANGVPPRCSAWAYFFARERAASSARRQYTFRRGVLYSTEPWRSAWTSTPSAAFSAAALIVAASRVLPASAASTPLALTAFVPAPVMPTPTFLPSAVTRAATPTTAKREAGWGNFMYAIPVPASQDGIRISTRISSGWRAVVRRPLKKSSTLIVRLPLGPSATSSAPSAMTAAG